MLRACKRVVVPGGPIVFDVVSVSDRVEDRSDLADDYGFVATDVPYVDLLAEVGFTGIGMMDTTAGYMTVARRWLAAARELEPELRSAMGDAVFEDKLASREGSFSLLETGELGRTLYWATG